MTVLRLTHAVYDVLRAHGEETYPLECCGALIGRSTPEGWQVEAAVRAGNIHSGSTHSNYQISPAELVKMEREARGRGLDIAGFYHIMELFCGLGRRIERENVRLVHAGRYGPFPHPSCPLPHRDK